MKRKFMGAAGLLMLLGSPIFAQTPAGGGSGIGGSDFRLGLAYIAMGIASGLCGLGQGKAVASASEGMARNPGAAAAIRGALILGLVLIESLALYTLVITFVAK
jgi:F-type H+-transporting ATPase subunit c